MRILNPASTVPESRRGAALLLSMLVLFVLVAITFQLNVSTGTDARVARNDVALTTMDLAIESALLQVHEQLKDDIAAGGGEADAGQPGQAPGSPLGDPGGGGDAAGGAGGSVDSREDSWGRPQPTEVNEILLDVYVQDEESKYNILNLLNPDQEEADRAFERVVRILDLCREDTRDDIDQGMGEDMARVMLEYMQDRSNSKFPRPHQLSDPTADEEQGEIGLPQSLREFIIFEPFEDRHFRDYYDEDGVSVHSLGAFLTIWTAPMLESELVPVDEEFGDPENPENPEGPETPDPETPEATPEEDPGEAAEDGLGGTSLIGSGGYGVNLNTASRAVLQGLFDGRDVDDFFWEEVVRYRNEEPEDEDDEDGDNDTSIDELPLDMQGDEQVPRQFFETAQDFAEVEGYSSFDPPIREELGRLLTLESQVFSIFITARRASDDEQSGALGEENLDEGRRKPGIVRVVRSIVWRRGEGENAEIVPLLRWEVLDYVPLVLEDYDEDEF